MDNFYDYREAMYWDIVEELKELEDDIEICDENFNDLYERLWERDYVTGNRVGSYTCNAYEAEKYLCHNWDLLFEAIDELNLENDTIREGPEHCDTIIRVYLLDKVLDNVLNDWKDIERDSNE